MRVKIPSVLVSKKVRGVKPLGTNSLKVNRVHKIMDRFWYTVLPPPFWTNPIVQFIKQRLLRSS